MEGINQRSRSAAAEDDGVDQIGFDSPRSGVATPQPDLHDRRLPGIMSYFNQVRASSFQRLLSGSFKTNGQAATTPKLATPETGDQSPVVSPAELPLTPVESDSCPGSSGEGPPLLAHEMVGPTAELLLGEGGQLHPYPSPPPSQQSSLRNSSSDSRSQKSRLGTSPASRPTSLCHLSTSDFGKAKARGTSLLAPLATTVDESSVSACHLSNPAGHASTAPSSPRRAQFSCVHFPSDDGDLSYASASLVHVKKLTDMSAKKSGASTPTRALSSTHPSQGEGQDDARQGNGDRVDRTATHTPTPPGAQAPAAKGKLTIKISEAKGLRRCRDPYVVVVFQRSELISAGPRPTEGKDDAAIAAVAMGGIPIQRQGSDSGRPMAIPMRSRQSSNTSITDFNTFRNRNSTSRRSFTNPKWDAEAIFDVVDSDMLVDISVYGHGQSGEEFLGHVDFQAMASEREGPVRGWFALKGHADTMVENTPTGEIFVEAFYQRAEQKHFGPEDFQILRLIGKGTFGQVYQVRKKDTKRIYAMKVLSKKVIVQKKEVAHTVGERNILVRTAMSDSPFIVGLKFSFQTPSDLYLVTDYMSGGELFWHLQKDGKFEEKRAKFYIAELILAIQHLHENDIVYRDLKPENILLDANGHIALCDFGLSKANLTKNDTTNTFCGTTEYLAPEVLLDESGYTKMVDFWSLGVLVFEMCCGWSPFYAEDTQQMYKNIAFGKVRFPRDTLSLEGRNFVKGLLNRNPKHRLGATDDAEELKRHAFFADIDWDALSKKLITPPFKPQLKNDTDVSYFDPEFTNALNTNGSLNERAAALAKGYATSTPLSPSVQANFQGFTFVDESALEDHMKDRYGKYEDEDMDDVGRKRDDDWDDLNDLDSRAANRMSCIVKGNANDEQMFGASNFDM
ncbi:Serine/threonine-protein kinase SCH9 [Madurella mycetomatis]|uniref:non-specific serine/threonine protein kinase n=1 Tax=Madurella mycetomatis TaxID=100816 RepID=A0A175W9X9_9PEZI|nr:Serine/threonine-protein kinase SCH9 [Madurella mycetomatis]KXX80536.1 Serine/threonine-protein kinase SCH9 [Madurella mycetomatis]